MLEARKMRNATVRDDGSSAGLTMTRLLGGRSNMPRHIIFANFDGVF